MNTGEQLGLASTVLPPEGPTDWDCLVSVSPFFYVTITQLSRVGYFSECSAGVWGNALQTGRSQIRFPMVSLEFFIDIILPAALCP